MEVTRRIRTSPRHTRRAQSPENSSLRLLAKLLRHLVTTQRFTDLADLKDAFRRRVLTLRIRCEQWEFDDAFGIVGSNLPLVHPAVASKSPAPPPVREALSPSEVRVALARVRDRLHVPSLKEMPPATFTTRGRADALRAFQMLAHEIAATSALCDALERDVAEGRG